MKTVTYNIYKDVNNHKGIENMAYNHESIQTTSGLPFRIFSFNEQNDGCFIPCSYAKKNELFLFSP